MLWRGAPRSGASHPCPPPYIWSRPWSPLLQSHPRAVFALRRYTSHCRNCVFLRSLLELTPDHFAKTHCHSLMLKVCIHSSTVAVTRAGKQCEPPRPMPWYPNSLAWHMNFSRAQLRKQPTLTALHEFIKKENEAGGITRQEAVSMVPPLFLDVQPHHYVRSF